MNNNIDIKASKTEKNIAIIIALFFNIVMVLGLSAIIHQLNIITKNTLIIIGSVWIIYFFIDTVVDLVKVNKGEDNVE